MKTSNSIHIIPAVLLVLSACTNDSLSPENGSEPARLRATFDADVAVTKSILVDNPGVKLESFWEAGEQIGVFGGNSGNVLFTLKAEDLSYDRKTADFTTGGSIPAGRLTGYSPYQKGAGSDGESIVIDFPAKQHYVTYNGVVQPDPAANILLGEGSKGSGLSFRNMTAVLKIGQAFETEKLIKTVEFRDLSGAAVSGTMKLTGGSHPKAEITGSGKVLTLDLGDGLEFPAGSMCPLFLIVPARDYAKGFEITFIDEKGGKTVHTVGTAMGKTLMRGVVYLIGDISGNEYPAESRTVLKDGATIMTPALLDKVKLLNAYTEKLVGPDGDYCRDENGDIIWVPMLNLLVSKDLNPKVGNWFIFEQPTKQLPGGGVFRIISVEDAGPDNCDIYIMQEGNVAAPFQEVKAGEPLYDDAGNYQENGGIELDIASHVSAIRDAEGNSIPFSVSADGTLLLAQEGVEQAFQSATKAKNWSHTFTPPKAALKFSQDNAEVSFGAQLSLSARVAVGMIQGELQYVYFTAQPVFNLSADFVLKAELDFHKSFHIFTIEIVPIVVAPGVVICPKLDLSGTVGLSGNIQFSVSAKYTYDMGRFGLSYNAGDGFTFRHIPPEPVKTEIQPEMGDIEGTVAAYGKLEANPYVSLYGVFGLGVRTSFGLKFGLQTSVGSPTKIFLTPELELVPNLIVASGWYSKNFRNLSTTIELSPIWERYLRPQVSFTGYTPVGPYKTLSSFKYAIGSGDDVAYYVTKPVYHGDNIMTDVDGIRVSAISKVPTLDTWTVAMDVLTGSTNLSWKQLVLRDAPVFPGYSEDDYSFTGIYSVGRYELFDIPAGQKEELNLFSSAVGKGAFPAGEIRSFRFVFINKDSGRVIGEKTMSGAQVPAVRSPFAVYWPETPDGPWFVTEPITADQYNDISRYPGNCPVKPKGSEKYSDGYCYGD